MKRENTLTNPASRNHSLRRPKLSYCSAAVALPFAGSAQHDRPKPAFALPINGRRLGRGARPLHRPGSVAQWRKRVAPRWWLGMAWRRLGAGRGLRISPSAALLCATTGLLLFTASLLPWPRVLPATGSLLSTAVSLRIRPRLLWFLQCVSWLWHAEPE